VEGNPAHAREVLVSILRRNQPTAGAASSDCARARRGGPARTKILFSRYGFHLRLNRQSAAHVREGIDLDVSTLADLVDAAAATPMPLVVLIRKQVFAAERIQYHHSGPC